MTAIVVFVKNPIPGKVKTRLAAQIGETKAVEIYLKLLRHTFEVIHNLPVTKYVYYSDLIPDEDIWSHDLFQKRLQSGSDLGERMHNAITEVQENHKDVILIGSDIADLDSLTLTDAFDSMRYVEVVIGPATDGGYYLIGCKTPNPPLFENIRWSTGGVFAETRERLLHQNLNFKVLERKSDIDTLEDIKRLGWNFTG